MNVNIKWGRKLSGQILTIHNDHITEKPAIKILYEAYSKGVLWTFGEKPRLYPDQIVVQ